MKTTCLSNVTLPKFICALMMSDNKKCLMAKGLMDFSIEETLSFSYAFANSCPMHHWMMCEEWTWLKLAWLPYVNWKKILHMVFSAIMTTSCITSKLCPWFSARSTEPSFIGLHDLWEPKDQWIWLDQPFQEVTILVQYACLIQNHWRTSCTGSGNVYGYLSLYLMGNLNGHKNPFIFVNVHVYW